MSMRKLGESFVGIIIVFFLAYMEPVFASISHKAGLWPAKVWLVIGICVIVVTFWGGLGIAYAKQKARDFLMVSIMFGIFTGSIFLGTIALSELIVAEYGSEMPAPYPVSAR